ncbi:hypothetical protein NP233_g8601 [Leucocoprinus birnbaumii]|uniref:Uncharacterized protein n=1 Tax=Leucocoprinus birnbaumii TaxID=56174 RepID=A0AAD5VM22_9AGAR|nr:hypothetical protein NP233_g8601 [Leucocoprinus birnbaumii]
MAAAYMSSLLAAHPHVSQFVDSNPMLKIGISVHPDWASAAIQNSPALQACISQDLLSCDWPSFPPRATSKIDGGGTTQNPPPTFTSASSPRATPASETPTSTVVSPGSTLPSETAHTDPTFGSQEGSTPPFVSDPAAAATTRTVFQPEIPAVSAQFAPEKSDSLLSPTLDFSSSSTAPSSSSSPITSSVMKHSRVNLRIIIPVVLVAVALIAGAFFDLEENAQKANILAQVLEPTAHSDGIADTKDNGSRFDDAERADSQEGGYGWGLGKRDEKVYRRAEREDHLNPAPAYSRDP